MRSFGLRMRVRGAFLGILWRQLPIDQGSFAVAFNIRRCAVEMRGAVCLRAVGDAPGAGGFGFVHLQKWNGTFYFPLCAWH